MTDKKQAVVIRTTKQKAFAILDGQPYVSFDFCKNWNKIDKIPSVDSEVRND